LSDDLTRLIEVMAKSMIFGLKLVFGKF